MYIQKNYPTNSVHSSSGKRVPQLNRLVTGGRMSLDSPDDSFSHKHRPINSPLMSPVNVANRILSPVQHPKRNRGNNLDMVSYYNPDIAPSGSIIPSSITGSEYTRSSTTTDSLLPQLYQSPTASSKRQHVLSPNPNLNQSTAMRGVAMSSQSQQTVQSPPSLNSMTTPINQPIITEEQKYSACTSLKGLKPGNPNWINQDNFFIIEPAYLDAATNGTLSMYCILDGHGENGHLVSRRCRDLLPQFLLHYFATSSSLPAIFRYMDSVDQNTLNPVMTCTPQNMSFAGLSSGNLLSAANAMASPIHLTPNGPRFQAMCDDIRSAFTAMQNDFNYMNGNESNGGFDSRCSGATCALVLLFRCGDKSVTVTANCGDSRAIIGRRQVCSSPTTKLLPRVPVDTNGFTAIALSNDHKPDRPDEKRRILNTGGNLGCRQIMVSPNGSAKTALPMPIGPCRVWYQHRGETLGLAMSRSLGDTIAHRSGVSAEPEILYHAVDNSSDDFIILATDGIWDVLDNTQCANLTYSNIMKSGDTISLSTTIPGYWSCFDVCHTLTKHARSKWERMSPMIDDITCIIIKLRN